MDSLQPTTDREIMIKLDSKMDNLAAALERFADTLENLEVNKLADIEKRLDKTEKFINEWGGVWKFVLIAGGILSIISVALQIKHG